MHRVAGRHKALMERIGDKALMETIGDKALMEMIGDKALMETTGDTALMERLQVGPRRCGVIRVSVIRR